MTSGTVACPSHTEIDTGHKKGPAALGPAVPHRLCPATKPLAGPQSPPDVLLGQEADLQRPLLQLQAQAGTLFGLLTAEELGRPSPTQAGNKSEGNPTSLVPAPAGFQGQPHLSVPS